MTTDNERDWNDRLPVNLLPEFADALRYVQDDPALPRVLIIGDSISLGYTPTVRAALRGLANVHRIPENGQHTGVGLREIEGWLGDGPWDIIHFNWGLHDVAYADASGQRVDPSVGERQVLEEDYAANLRQLVARLQATGATLIWASTTPIPAGTKDRLPGDAARYNSIAAPIMAELGVRINDLYATITPHLAATQRPANVHFTAYGSAFLGARVAALIANELS